MDYATFEIIVTAAFVVAAIAWVVFDKWRP